MDNIIQKIFENFPIFLQKQKNFRNFQIFEIFRKFSVFAKILGNVQIFFQNNAKIFENFPIFLQKHKIFKKKSNI